MRAVVRPQGQSEGSGRCFVILTGKSTQLLHCVGIGVGTISHPGVKKATSQNNSPPSSTEEDVPRTAVPEYLYVAFKRKSRKDFCIMTEHAARTVFHKDTRQRPRRVHRDVDDWAINASHSCQRLKAVLQAGRQTSAS